MRSDASDASDASDDNRQVNGRPGQPRPVGDLLPGWMERFTTQRAEWQRRTDEHRTAFFADGGQCWTCRDTGYVNGWQGDGATPCEACASGATVIQRLRDDLVTRTLAACGLPRRFSAWSFDTFPKTARKRGAAVRRFTEQRDLTSGQGLLLLGDSSVGKTGLLVSALRRVVERQVAAQEPSTLPLALAGVRRVGHPGHPGELSVWFTTDAALLKGLRDGYTNDTYHALTQRAETCGLLVIDDFGKADYKGGTGWGVEQLYGIINTRYTELRPTWFSTNLGLEQLTGCLGEMGEPIMDRVLDSCEAITITGAKLRMGLNQGATA
jgi:DNA replication protein DnaC